MRVDRRGGLRAEHQVSAAGIDAASVAERGTDQQVGGAVAVPSPAPETLRPVPSACHSRDDEAVRRSEIGQIDVGEPARLAMDHA